jgi:hypothetical protein
VACRSGEVSLVEAFVSSLIECPLSPQSLRPHRVRGGVGGARGRSGRCSKPPRFIKPPCESVRTTSPLTSPECAVRLRHSKEFLVSLGCWCPSPIPGPDTQAFHAQCRRLWGLERPSIG